MTVHPLSNLNRAVAEPIPNIIQRVPVLSVHHPIRDRVSERVRCHVANGRDSRWRRTKTALLGVAIVLMSRLRLLCPLIAVAEAESINLFLDATGLDCGLVIAAGLMIYQVDRYQ
jgi:hypothetical protein